MDFNWIQSYTVSWIMDESVNRSRGFKKTLPQTGGSAQAALKLEMKVGSYIERGWDYTLIRPAADSNVGYILV